MEIIQVKDNIILIGDTYYMESDEESFFYKLEDIEFDEWGKPVSYSLDISDHIDNIIQS